MSDHDTAQMVVDLRATDDAVRAKGWVAPGLGVPGAPLGLLGSTLNPLGGLAAAGLGWFMPLVSFLGEGLTQLQGGNGASVSSGSQDFGDAGQDIAGVADTYRRSAVEQTSGWTGTAASEYRDSATRHAEGIAGLGEASNTVGSAIIGAGQVVAQAIAEITELIAEAVAQIVPIMTQAVARAGETFGQSVVEAIPPCVAIAVEYALRIAAKLAALVASGDNLLKLVQGALGVVDLIKAALTSISHQSTQPGMDPQAAGGGGGAGGGSPRDEVASALSAADPGAPTDAAGAGNAGSPPSGGGSGAGGSGGVPTVASGGAAPGGSATPTLSPGADTRSSAAIPQLPPPHSAMTEASRFPSSSTGGFSGGPGGGVSGGVLGGVSGGVSGGVMPGAAPLAPGSGVGAGRDTTRQEGSRSQAAARTTAKGGVAGAGGFPMGAMPAGRPGEQDKEHQRKYPVVENHEETTLVAPPVIT